MSVQGQTTEKTRIDLQKPRRYRVIMHNDDFTSMEFVVEILPPESENAPEFSQGMGNVLFYAWESAQNSGKDRAWSRRSFCGR